MKGKMRQMLTAASNSATQRYVRQTQSTRVPYMRTEWRRAPSQDCPWPMTWFALINYAEVKDQNATRLATKICHGELFRSLRPARSRAYDTISPLRSFTIPFPDELFHEIFELACRVLARNRACTNRCACRLHQQRKTQRFGV